MELGCSGTLQIPELLTADVKRKDQILVRVVMKGRSQIKVMSSFGGEVFSQFPSKCDHIFACLIAHPIHEGFALESCSSCEVIRNYDFQTGRCSIVYLGFKPITMCHGPTRSILVLFRVPSFAMPYYPKDVYSEARSYTSSLRTFTCPSLLSVQPYVELSTQLDLYHTPQYYHG